MKRRKPASVERKRAMHRQAQARYHARLRERAMAALGCGPRCQECAFPEMEDFEPVRLEFAHVAPTKLNGRGRGTYRRLRDVEKNPEAYRLLCRPCHMDLDYGGRDRWNPAAPDSAQRELEEVPF